MSTKMLNEVKNSQSVCPEQGTCLYVTKFQISRIVRDLLCIAEAYWKLFTKPTPQPCSLCSLIIGSQGTKSWPFYFYYEFLK